MKFFLKVYVVFNECFLTFIYIYIYIKNLLNVFLLLF